MSILKVFKFFLQFYLIFHKAHCQISDCVMPEDFVESRSNRLHHPCESNRNSFFLIETQENFYCIFYWSIDTSIFGENSVEMRIDGEWEAEESGSESFSTNSSFISFTVLWTDVTIKISSTNNDDELPKISSVFVTMNNKSEDYCANTKCGIRSDAVPVIINGEKVREGSWPWHAAIYHRLAVNLIKFRCGSSIINERTVITIATCLVTYSQELRKRVIFDTDKLYVAVGETILFGSSSSTKQVVQVDAIKFHEKYSKDYTSDTVYKDDFNVALIILKENIAYTTHVQPICLPESDVYDYDNKIGKVVGWGFSEAGDLKLSQHLQELTIPTYNYLTCMLRALNRTIYYGFSSTRNFCAGYLENRGICAGDSGGGLYIEENGKYHIYGLASYANCECIEEKNECRIFGEGFFVNLVAFLQWIHNNVY